MNKKKAYSILIIVIVCLIGIFCFSDAITKNIIFSINMFMNNVFPSLFPMFILSEMLISIGIPEYLGSKFSKVFSFLFNTPGISSFVFFMSFITGFPSSSKYVNDLLDKGMIDNSEASRILNYTFFSNPLFIINTIGVLFLRDKKVAFYMLISNTIANILTGIILRGKKKCLYSNEVKINLIESINKVDIFKVLFNSIKKAISVMASIFGAITFSLILLGIISNLFNFNEVINILVTGLFEITSGIKLLSLSSFNKMLIYALTMFFISFGGVSIHAQMFSILQNKKVKYLPFLKARIIHSIISVIILLLFIYLI